jgi:hypothetical protein
MTIEFNTAEEFFDGCAAMTARNIAYKATFNNLTIVVTGY